MTVEAKPNPGEELLEEIAPHLGFWQEAWVQNGLPIIASVLVHIGLILLGLVTYTAYKAATTVTQEQIIVPDAAIVAGDVGGIPNPGLGGDPDRPAASDLVPENTRTEGWNKLPSKSLQAAIVGGSGDTASDTLIGLGAGQSMGKGKGSGVGSGEGDGASAPFGVPGGGKGLGPRSRFMGVSGNARTVVYVCDASGSMMGNPSFLVKEELRKAVDALAPVQAFNIVFFKEPLQSFSDKLLLAKPANKVQAAAWLNQVHEGANSNPVPALRIAFAEHPDLIYLLTDGDFTFSGTVTNEEVIEAIKKFNASKRTHVFTIAFFSPDTAKADRDACEKVLRTIASENGGEFKIVLTSELMK